MTARFTMDAGTIAAYAVAGRSRKSAILDDIMATRKCSRPQARRLLLPRSAPAAAVGRPSFYSSTTRMALTEVWDLLFRPTARYLAASLPDAVAALANHRHPAFSDPSVREQLLTLSPATIDRMLQDARAGERVVTEDTVRQLRQAIGTPPRGAFQDAGDTVISIVAHCGHAPHSRHLSTIALVDRLSGWTELAVVSRVNSASIRRLLDEWQRVVPYTPRRLVAAKGSERIGEDVRAWADGKGLAFGSVRPHSYDPLCPPKPAPSTNVFYRRLHTERDERALRTFHRSMAPLLNGYLASAPHGAGAMTAYRRLRAAGAIEARAWNDDLVALIDVIRAFGFGAAGDRVRVAEPAIAELTPRWTGRASESGDRALAIA
jgi:hypothetical protein